MGVLTFHLPPSPTPAAWHALDRVRFVGGYDRTPFLAQLKFEGSRLELTREQSDSGYASVPWPIPDLGFPVTVSATLRERSQPYYLLLELARGKINQLRSAIADWQQAGLQIPAEILAALKDAAAIFGHTAVNADDPQFDRAIDALEKAYAVSAALTQFYIASAAHLQPARIGRNSSRLSCRLEKPLAPEHAEHYRTAFDTAHVVPLWNEIERTASNYDWTALDAAVASAMGQGVPVLIGPLVDLGGKALPDWLCEWDGDGPTLTAYFCDFVETAIHRYKHRIKDWLICGGFNHSDHLGLTEDDRLRLAVRILDAARGADPDGRWIVGITQPWGDYLDSEDSTYSPLVFADTLLRTGLPIAGFELEILAGPSPRASFLRDGMETIRLLELFSLLGVPIDVCALHPGRDVAAAATTALDAKLMNCLRASDAADAQADWGGQLAAIASCMSHIRCVCWGRWADGADHTGLIAADGHLKPLLFRLRHLLAAHGG